MQGVHLTADLFDCAASARALLLDRSALQDVCVRLVRKAGLTVVGGDFHQFANVADQPGGVTGLVLLAESHLAVHTWPEINAVTLDVYVCNFTEDNTHKAAVLCEALISLFAPARCNQNRVQRGTLGTGDAAVAPVPPVASDKRAAAELAMEWLSPTVLHGFTERSAPLTAPSPLQRIQWHDTHALGRVLSLDGALMVSERDEFVYHECMVHVPALAHPAPRSALILGGGDGCTARELLKYPSVTRIVIAELDAAVIASCRTHFADVNENAFDDPRVEIVIGDALATLQNSPECFDLVIMDLTDPSAPSDPRPASASASPDPNANANAHGHGHAGALYSAETYALIATRLTEHGILTTHIGSAFHHPERMRKTLADLRRVFACVAAYKAFMPIYGAEWGMACASKQINPATLTASAIAEKLERHRLVNLRFYCAEVHASLFAWPVYAHSLGV